MLFTNVMALVDESTNDVNAKLERCHEALESKDFKLSRTKTKYMNCNFSKDVLRDEPPVRIEAQ